MFNFSFLHFLFRSRYLLHIHKGKLLEMAEIKLEYAFIHIILINFFLSETLGGGGGGGGDMPLPRSVRP